MAMERIDKMHTDFRILEVTLEKLDDDHSVTALEKIKKCLNDLFVKSKCKGVIYTRNTDKLFFGMRVYVDLDGNKAVEMLGNDHLEIFPSYFVEIDSKLLDPMLYLEGKELTALLLHEVGHIVYDTTAADEVRNAIDAYFARSGGYINIKSSRGLKELLAYAMKESVMKAGTIFAKIGNTEMIADAFVTSCGYGPELESAVRKIRTGVNYFKKDIDNRFLALSWVLRVALEFDLFRMPAIKTLNKAVKLTGSNLEKKELTYAAKVLSQMEDPMNEGFVDWIGKRALDWKRKGIRGVKADVYELQLRIRTAEDIDDLMSIIRTCNTHIALIQDYLTEDIPDIEREELNGVLQDLYSIRQEASKNKQVKSRYSGYIQVVYPTID